MDERFNPYAEWLLIECQERPDHYALLGLERFETDGRVIASAADRRIAQLRQSATKERLAVAQRVAKEIIAARNCLLSTADRTDYEALLRDGRSTVVAPGTPRLFLPPKAFDEDDDDVAIEAEEAPLEGIPIPSDGEQLVSAAATLAEAPPIAAPVVAAPDFGAGVAVRAVGAPAATKRVSPWTLALGGCAVGLLGVLAAVLAPKWLASETTVATNPTAPSTAPVVHTDFGYRPPEVTGVDASSDATGSPENESSTPTVDPQAQPAPELVEQPASAMSETAAPEMAPTSEASAAPMTETAPPTAMTAPGMLTSEEAAANVQATQSSLAAARRAMSEGDVEQAIEQVELAELEAIAEQAVELVAQSRAGLEFLRGFWRAVDEGFLGLAAGQEFEFDGRTVVVVERTPDRLVIRSAGKNRRYERRRLPPEVALFLANRWLKPDDANTPLFLAAFHVFDGDGDRAEARKLLEASRTSGTPGAEDLLTILDAEK